MSSVMGREDLKARLYQNGIKNPRVLNETMRIIDVYSLRIARNLEEQHYEDIAPVFTPLEPGQWSAALEVTCCVKCEQVKRWDLFHLDQRHSTGHKTVCKDCRRKEDEEDGKPPYVPDKVRRGGWVCVTCGQRKPPAEFPEEKHRNTRKQ